MSYRILSVAVGVGMLVAVTCFSSWSVAAAPHVHPTEGPHKGSLVELGAEEFHAEVTHDDKSATVTIYLLGPDAKTAVTSESKEVLVNVKLHGKPMQMKLKAMPMSGEKAGSSSRYGGVSKDLIHALDHADSVPHLRVTIAGKSYVGKIAATQGHDHDHDHANSPKGKVKAGSKR